jgi:hypothetical protein
MRNGGGLRVLAAVLERVLDGANETPVHGKQARRRP